MVSSNSPLLTYGGNGITSAFELPNMSGPHSLQLCSNLEEDIVPKYFYLLVVDAITNIIELDYALAFDFLSPYFNLE